MGSRQVEDTGVLVFQGLDIRETLHLPIDTLMVLEDEGVELDLDHVDP
ncbi:MAG: hypothetical protein V4587_06230 [Acidobacteriota bacterium]